jgi:hypothetical protein
MLSTYCFSLIFEFPQKRLSATVTFAISDSRKRRAYILQIDFSISFLNKQDIIYTYTLNMYIGI